MIRPMLNVARAFGRRIFRVLDRQRQLRDDG